MPMLQVCLPFYEQNCLCLNFLFSYFTSSPILVSVINKVVIIGAASL